MITDIQDLKSSISYKEGGIFSKVLHKDDANLTLFCMAAGTSISDHTAKRHAMIYVIEGNGVFVLEGKKISMKEHVIIMMNKDAVHSLSVKKNTAFLLMLYGN